jgi:hypothetical protein
MIVSHLYAKNIETPVYPDQRDNANPVFILHQGDWMGVLEARGDWIRVLSIHGEGWVRQGEVEYRPSGELHIVLSDNLNIEYVNMAIEAHG